MITLQSNGKQKLKSLLHLTFFFKNLLVTGLKEPSFTLVSESWQAKDVISSSTSSLALGTGKLSTSSSRGSVSTTGAAGVEGEESVKSTFTSVGGGWGTE